MNATVTLPISELDTLRDSIKSANEKVAEFEKYEKKVKVLVVKKEQAYNFFTGAYGINSIYYKPKLEEREVISSTTYIGLDEVKNDLRFKAEQAVIEKLNSLENSVKVEQKTRLETVDKIREESAKALAAKDEEIASLKGEEIDKTEKEKLSKAIHNLQNRVSDLVRDKNSLEKTLKGLHERNWFKRLFNID